MRKDRYAEYLRSHLSDFVPGSMSFLGWNRFKAEVEAGQKVIRWRGLKIVRIPQIEGRVYLEPNILNREDLRGVNYIWKLNNPNEPADSENQAAMIGLSIPSVQPGWMIARSEYDEFFDEDGNLIGQEDEPATENAETEESTEPEENTAAETDAEPETPAGKEQTAEHPENEDHAAPEVQKETAPASTKEKRKTETTEKKTGGKKTTKADAREENRLEEMEARLLEKEKILDKKMQQVEEERQRLQQKEAEIKEQMKQMEEIRNGLDSIKKERLLRVTDRQRQRMDLLHSILRSHTRTIDELAKRKPYGLMSLQQIRTVNEILDEIRQSVAETDAADFLHLAEEPRMDDLEHFPGTTYSEMALIISAYQYIRTSYKWERLYMKDPADESEADGSNDDDSRQ